MYNTTEIFMEKMQEFFPITREKYEKSVICQRVVLETVVIEDIFWPEIINLLKINKNVELIKDLFDYFEEIVKGDDVRLTNILSVTILENLGNDKGILKIAQCYMGPKTRMLQIEADKALGRI